MNEPTLIVMAAGMGSRYGGLKQIDPVNAQGEIILDFSLYDAMMAGFKKVVFVIKEEMEDDFRNLMDERAGKYMEINYVFQKLEDLPAGYEIPEGREKPWGTGHAVMSCRHIIDGPFAVINADDYYGAGGFQAMYDFLTQNKDKTKYSYCMVGFKLRNTITDNGHVSRGVCEIIEENNLKSVKERIKIMKKDGNIVYFEEGTEKFHKLEGDTLVSMNFWGFTKSMMQEMEQEFPQVLDHIYKENPLKGEYHLPAVVDRLVREQKAVVKVLESMEKWYGVTYKEDKEEVVAALQSMKDKRIYPEKMWK